MTIHESTLSLGLICGSAAGGMLFNVSSMAHVYAMSASVLAAGIMVQWIICLYFRQPKTATKSPA
jgi:predicted MFS family arabinose efflux permease